jgi:hypothetical protein
VRFQAWARGGLFKLYGRLARNLIEPAVVFFLSVGMDFSVRFEPVVE